VAAGRLGTAVMAILLPGVAVALVHGLGLDGGRSRSRSAWAAALGLGVMTAFVPLTAGVVAVLAVPALAVVRGRALLRLALLVGVPPVLLLPWLPAVVADPQLLLLESGLAGRALTAPDLAATSVLLLRPGGPGLPPPLLAAALLLVALVGLLRPDRRRAVLAGWLVALVGLAGAVLVSRVTVTAPGSQGAVPAWPGPALLVAGAGLVLAATAGAQGVRTRVASRSFGWRQPSAAALAALAALAPVVTAGWWVWAGAGGPLRRADPALLPAFVAAEAAQPDRPRTLVLRSRGSARLSYTLLRADGPRTGDAELSGAAGTGLAAVVADLASGRGGDAAARLVPYGVRFVLLSAPVSEALTRAVDTATGVVRVSGAEGSVLWRVDFPTGRLRVLPARAPVTTEEGAPPPARTLPAGEVTADTEVPAGTDGRLLVLADRRDDKWQARLDGQLLPARTYAGWAQAFSLPAEGGRLHLEYDAGWRTPLLWVQLGCVLLVVVLALPTAGAGSDGDLGRGA
jgi:hypothetical protein